MRTTKKQFAAFKTAFIGMQKRLGLTEWKVYFQRADLTEDNAYGQLAADLHGCVATVTMTSHVAKKDADDFDPAKTGKHEALHLLLEGIGTLARWRYITSDEIGVELERIVRRLEKVL